MSLFVNASARQMMAFSGYLVDVRIQYRNMTDELVSIWPNRAVFELLDSADRTVQRHSPLAVAHVVAPGECFRFEFNFTTQADIQNGKYSLRSVVGDESAYSFVQFRSVPGLAEATGQLAAECIVPAL